MYGSNFGEHCRKRHIDNRSGLFEIEQPEPLGFDGNVDEFVGAGIQHSGPGCLEQQTTTPANRETQQ